MFELGPLIARGSTSDVYSVGDDSVAKVPKPGVPQHWTTLEAELTRSVHEVGFPTPAVRDLIDFDGRKVIVFERIVGPSMWEQAKDEPSAVPELAGLLAQIHLDLLQLPAPAELPSLRERAIGKIGEAKGLSSDLRAKATSQLVGLPQGAALCHGDLHPGNVLMSERGPIVIDWFDAASGNGAADVVRTSLLIRSPRRPGIDVPHLEGASGGLLDDLHRGYVEGIVCRAGAEPSALLDWEPVLAASRLAEPLIGSGLRHELLDICQLTYGEEDSHDRLTTLAAELRQLETFEP